MEELVDGDRWRDGGKEVWTVGWRNLRRYIWSDELRDGWMEEWVVCWMEGCGWRG